MTNVLNAFFIYQSTFGGGSPNEGQVMFDTSSFLNWWFGGKKSSGILGANGKETSIDTKLDSQRQLKTELTAVPTASVGIEQTYENSKSNLINKSSATIVSRSSIDTPFIAGYMDSILWWLQPEFIQPQHTTEDAAPHGLTVATRLLIVYVQCKQTINTNAQIVTDSYNFYCIKFLFRRFRQSYSYNAVQHIYFRKIINKSVINKTTVFLSGSADQNSKTVN
jgi:hypothetical protein